MQNGIAKSSNKLLAYLTTICIGLTAISTPVFCQDDTTGLVKYYVDKTKKKPARENTATQSAMLLPPGCSITGTSPASGGNTIYYYMLTCDNGEVADYWTVSCGTVVTQYFDEVDVRWNVSGCTSGTVKAYDFSGTLLASKTVTITTVALAGGTISNPTQTIACGTTPALIQASVATGGSCSPSYNYQWQQSTDNVNFTDIAGATGQNYQPGALSVTTYFRRMVTCGCAMCYLNNAPAEQGLASSPHHSDDPGEAVLQSSSSMAYIVNQNGPRLDASADMAYADIESEASSTNEPPLATNYYVETAYTTNNATVTVTALTGGGSISNSSQTINYNLAPAQIMATAATGGNATYQWQQSTNGTTYTDISGATGQNYQPGNLTTTTYFKRRSSCGATVLYTTNTATVTVLPPPFNGGCITSGNQTIPSGSTPSTISASLPIGGTCGSSYAYQWMSSPDNIYFTNLTGAISQNLSFSSGLTKTTYYQRKVTCGSETVTTTSVKVTVN